MSVTHTDDPQFPGVTYTVSWYCQECGYDYNLAMPEHTADWEPSQTYSGCPGCGADPVDSAAWCDDGLEDYDP